PTITLLPAATIGPGVTAAFVRIMLFFASGGRRTRSDRDWSSDVCSSDLPPQAPAPASIYDRAKLAQALGAAHFYCYPSLAGRGRSEERRVGKECRGGGLCSPECD